MLALAPCSQRSPCASDGRTKKLRPCKNAKTKLKNHFAVPLCLPALDGPLLRVTCANRRKTGFTPGRAVILACPRFHQPHGSLHQAFGRRSRSLRTSAITACAALATRGQCKHCLPLVGLCPTSNTGIIARLGAVVKPEIAGNGSHRRLMATPPSGREAFGFGVLSLPP